MSDGGLLEKNQKGPCGESHFVKGGASLNLLMRVWEWGYIDI